MHQTKKVTNSWRRVECWHSTFGSGMLAQYFRLVTVPGGSRRYFSRHGVAGSSGQYGSACGFTRDLWLQIPRQEQVETVVADWTSVECCHFWRGWVPRSQACWYFCHFTGTEKAEGACYNFGKHGDDIRLMTCSRCQGRWTTSETYNNYLPSSRYVNRYRHGQNLTNATFSSTLPQMQCIAAQNASVQIEKKTYAFL
jgi:hypothetical protein